MQGSETADALAIRVDGARKRYAGVSSALREAVSDVSLSVSRGTIHGLLGPNGAGKTTTLKMLLGLVRPTAGTFEILGERSRRPEVLRRVGFLPEQPYFPMQLTAAEALHLYGRLSGMDRVRIAGRAAELLEVVGLEGNDRTQLSHFSRGMLQRFGLAQALIAEPEVVVLDEPASGLDPVGQRDVRNLMLELRSAGVTVLLSSHQLSEAEAVCDRVSVLHAGRVASEGSLDDLLNIAGRTSVRVSDVGDRLPERIEALVDDVALAGGVWVFSVPDSSVRTVVDAVDDLGGRIQSLQPKRESLEDYFARLVATPAKVEAEEVAA